MDEFDWVDRDRGILTKRDRRFLRGDLDEELNDNQKYQKRYQIRQRIRNSMFDFHILYRALSRRDISMLWDETDDWIYRAQKANKRGEKPPRVPLLARCWRDIIAFFVYAQITTETPEAENLTDWVIEEGINKAVRRHTFENHEMYREVDSTLDWGVGSAYYIDEYLEYLKDQIPDEPEDAENYLLRLQQDGFILGSHAKYLYNNHVKQKDS